MASSAFLSADLSVSPPISELEHERDWLRAAMRAELEAVRRGEGSMLVADDLSRRLNLVETRIVRFLVDLFQIG
ncbi:MAG TPA: hypothetical protein VFW23_06185 [Tepidisphaeraceae bacterium]|nr:hypothetical protein [Tepidisphaeraceae bacterium]